MLGKMEIKKLGN